jgi:hypothetical protein
MVRTALVASLVAAGTATMALRRSGTWHRLGAWGMDSALAASTLPGDELVVDPVAVDTRTLEIDASPAAIWPWFVQMGDHRGGEYSYSLFGFPHRKGADRIVPEWQDLAVGDRINQWFVRELEPERALVLHSDVGGSWSWVFVLQPTGDSGRTRLVERIRSRPALPRRIGAAVMRVLGPGTFLMVRKQMLTIRQRAEATRV